MAAMKLYYGSDLVGGDVDLADFEKLEADVEGKYDKGDPSILDGGVMAYDNAALMEQAVLGNAGDIATLRQDIMDNLIPALQEGGQNIEAEFTKYFPIYGDDNALALMYDNAAELGLAVSKNIQDIADEVSARKAGDTDTLTSANTHSDANDALTLQSANEYTDDAIAAIDGIDGLQEVETEAVRNANRAGAKPGDAEAGVMRMEVVAELPDSPDEFTLYVVTG